MREELLLHRVDVKGGVLSPIELQQIIEYAKGMGLDTFHFGSRQDIIFPLKDNKGNLLSEHESFDASYFASAEQQNISCSYVSIDIFNSTFWLRGTTYLYILEEFRYAPTLKINITDPKQQIEIEEHAPRRITLTLDDQHLIKLREIAKKRKTYLKEMIKEIVADYLQQH